MIDAGTPSPNTLSRRQFLTGITAVGMSSLLGGCWGKSGPTLNIRALNGAVPQQVVKEFSKFLKESSQAGSLTIAPETQLQALFALLQTWKRLDPNDKSFRMPGWVPIVGDRTPRQVPDLITLGNYWLDKAIEQQLIQPIDPQKISGWAELNDRWKAAATRQGKVWGMPYRWGSTAIAYRQDIFKDKGLQLPTDWSDLWRSDLKQHISLLDQPREVIGLTLKKLGQSYNTTNLSNVKSLVPELQALHQQVKFYSSEYYLQPLILGDTWLAVGWSTDLLTLAQRNPTIQVVMPKSGTALWTELWVRPAQAGELSDLALQWLDFSNRSPLSAQYSLLSQATATSIPIPAPDTLPTTLRANPLLSPSAETFIASEILQPLDKEAIATYQTLWKQIRR